MKMKKLLFSLWLALGGCAPAQYDMNDNRFKPGSIEDVIKATIGIRTEHTYESDTLKVKVQGGATAFGIAYRDGFTYFLTAQHVSDHPAEMRGATYTASAYTFGEDDRPLNMVVEDDKTDIAIYRAGGSFPLFRDFAEPERIKTGIRVYSVGFPLMLGAYLKSGMVAGRNEDYIILDAHTNLGDSGSPVVALDGGEAKLIGMTVVKYQIGEGIGGIVPVEKIHKFLERNGFGAED